MLTLPTTPELESRLEQEAAKRGLHAAEYAVRLIEGLLQPNTSSDAAEQARLDAIDDRTPPASEPNPYDALFALAGQDAVDPDAYKSLRAASEL